MVGPSQPARFPGSAVAPPKPRVGLAAMSVGAALIYASAVSAHREHALLAAGFAIAAVAQAGWAMLVLARPASRAVLASGVLLNAALVGVYLAGRTTGLPIDGLETAEPFDADHADAHDRLGVTSKQQARADELVADTKAGLVRWEDPAVATADGFRSIGDGRRPGGYEHYINSEYVADPGVLDPEHPESLVYQAHADGTGTLVSAMYILPPGSTIDDAPDLGSELAVWHDHDNLCWDDDGLAGIVVNGTCVPGGEFRGTSAPMLHVWVVENPCGPFAGIEGGAGGHGQSCDHDDAHD